MHQYLRGICLWAGSTFTTPLGALSSHSPRTLSSPHEASSSVLTPARSSSPLYENAALADHEVVWEEEAGFEEEDKKGGKRHRAFEVILSDTKPKGAKNWLPTQVHR